MDWNKAKNLTIICLLLLNFILLILVYADSRKYITTPEEKEAIYNVLAQNHITLDSKFIEKYKPMERIIMSAYNYDTQLLFNAFLKESEITQTFEENKTIFKGNSNQTLTIDNDYVFFEGNAKTINDGNEIGEIDDKKALEICDKFVAKHEELFPQFVFDKISETDNGYQVEYRQKYKDYVIYSNYIIFSVSNSDLFAMEYTLHSPLKFDNNPTEIMSADQALFMLIREGSVLSNYTPITIEKMDVVYFSDAIEDEIDGTSKTIPCYRFYIETYKTPLLIDAYNGDIKNGL